jgi:hypothetical protein
MPAAELLGVDDLMLRSDNDDLARDQEMKVPRETDYLGGVLLTPDGTFRQGAKRLVGGSEIDVAGGRCHNQGKQQVRQKGKDP